MHDTIRKDSEFFARFPPKFFPPRERSGRLLLLLTPSVSPNNKATEPLGRFTIDTECTRGFEAAHFLCINHNAARQLSPSHADGRSRKQATNTPKHPQELSQSSFSVPKDRNSFHKELHSRNLSQRKHAPFNAAIHISNNPNDQQKEETLLCCSNSVGSDSLDVSAVSGKWPLFGKRLQPASTGAHCHDEYYRASKNAIIIK